MTKEENNPATVADNANIPSIEIQPGSLVSFKQGITGSVDIVVPGGNVMHVTEMGYIDPCDISVIGDQISITMIEAE